MAYAAVVSVRQVGSTEFLVQINETDCGPNDEATIDVAAAALGPGVPLVGKIRRQTVVLQAGTATTVNGILGEVPDPPANPTRVVCENNPTVQPIPAINDTQGIATYKDATPSPLGPWGRLFHRSQPDAGADNTITTFYHISSGW